MRPTSSAPTAAWAPPSSIIRREKVIDWCALVIRMCFIGRASTRSMRETSQREAGKTQMEMTSGGDHRVSGGAASTSAATRHCSHSSIAISTAASTHSIQ